MAAQNTILDGTGRVRIAGTITGAPVVAVVPLSSADILALDTTPKTIVAGVTGRAIVPVSSPCIVTSAGTGYSGAASTKLFTGTNPATPGWGPATILAAADIWGTASSAVICNDAADALRADVEPQSLLTGQPLSLYVSGASLTGGTLAATVYLPYYLVDI